MNKHKSNKIKENSNTVRHLIIGQIITTQNLVAIKEVRHAGQWHERHGVSNHWHYNDVIMVATASQITSLAVKFGCRSMKTSPRHWLLCGEFTGDQFPAQMASNAESVSIWWRHHGYLGCLSVIRKSFLCHDVIKSKTVISDHNSGKGNVIGLNLDEIRLIVEGLFCIPDLMKRVSGG